MADGRQRSGRVTAGAGRHYCRPPPTYEINPQKIRTNSQKTYRTTPVLNALRPQWNPHVRPASSKDSIRCAQRLAASMESSLCMTVTSVCKGVVLNALRHQWNPHSGSLPVHSTASECSTPCGINGILTIGAAGRCRDGVVLNA